MAPGRSPCAPTLRTVPPVIATGLPAGNGAGDTGSGGRGLSSTFSVLAAASPGAGTLARVALVVLLRLVEAPVDEHVAGLGVLGERLAGPGHHVRELARLEAARRLGERQRFGGAQRRGAQRRLARKALLDRGPDAGHEVGRPRRGQREGHARLVQLGRVALGVPDPAALLLLVEAAEEARGARRVEVDADEERRPARLQQLDGAERLRHARQHDLDPELVGERQRAPRVVLERAGDDERQASGEHLLPRRERRVVARPLLPARRFLPRRPGVARARGVEQRLPRIGHRAHERARVLARGGRQVQVKGPGLAQHHRLGPLARQVQDHALAGQDTFLRDHQRGRDAACPGLDHLSHPDSLERECLGQERRRRRARGASTAGSRGAGGPRRRGEAHRGEGVDEPRRHDQALAVEHARAGRRRHVGADRCDQPVVHHDRRALVDRAGYGDDARADDRVGVRLLCPGRERGEREGGEKRQSSHGSSGWPFGTEGEVYNGLEGRPVA